MSTSVELESQLNELFKEVVNLKNRVENIENLHPSILPTHILKEEKQMESITQEELAEVLRLHRLWRIESRRGKRANLQIMNLRGVDLRKVDLQEAFLPGVDFQGANLEEADFFGAELEGADFRGANLREARFSCAKLKGAKFERANLEDTVFPTKVDWYS